MFLLSGRSVYVSGLINHTCASLLLDTGVTSSILYAEMWKNSGQYCPEKLQKFNSMLIVANRQKLVIQGRVVINMHFGNSLFKVPTVVVRDIPHACILGSDFFKWESCGSLYDVGTFVVQGEVIPIFYQRKAPSICCVVVEEEVELEAGTELVLCGKLEHRFAQNSGKAPKQVLHSMHLDHSKGRETSYPHGKFLRANHVVEARPNCGSVLPP